MFEKKCVNLPNKRSASGVCGQRVAFLFGAELFSLEEGLIFYNSPFVSVKNDVQNLQFNYFDMKSVMTRTHFLLKKLLLVLLCVAFFFSCGQKPSFKVEGTVENAEGDTLYLEHRGLSGIVKLDSTVLKGNGAFAFRQPAPANPEFYQLRIGGQSAVFAVDSIETLTASANADDLYHSFVVKDSPANDQLKEVNELIEKASSEINVLDEQHKSGVIDDMTFLTRLDTVLQQYKTEASHMILANPSSASAYYAVFQKINHYLVFDPYSRKDYPMFGAVATSWHRYFPDTERSKHLYEFTMSALKTRRKQEEQAKLLESVPVVEDAGIPDIELQQVDGQKASLSSLKGKVVLVDFTVYSADYSPKHNILLNELYRRYQSRGLEIYQVSFDSDEHFWKTSAANLPWITVRDPQSVNALLLATYNIRQFPTAFLINREGDAVARIESFDTLEGELDKVF